MLYDEDMKFIYSSHANEGGVYKLTNTTNGRIYIGSTYRFKKRFPQCYNLRSDVCDSREGKKQNKPSNPLTDKRCQPHDDQHKAAIGSANKAAWQDPALREQAAQDANKRWNSNQFPTYNLVNNITGEKISLSSSLRKWCTERGFNYKAMHLMVSGKTKTSCGGWSINR